MKPIQIGLLILKLFVTGVLLWYVSSKVDLAPLMTRFESLQSGWAATGLTILLVSLLLTMVRWHIVSNMVGAGISYRLALQLILLGAVFQSGVAVLGGWRRCTRLDTFA